MASHTLDDEEYQKLHNDRRLAELRASELEAEIVRVRGEDSANRIKPLNALVRAQLEITRFAVANLNPENTRGWPTKALISVADLLSAMPDFTPDDTVLAIELRSFASTCDSYALQREQMRADKLKADANAPKGDLDRPSTENAS